MSLTGASWHGRGRAIIVMGLFGAALLYGDGIVTPAISVLSALEGLNVATDFFKPHVMPMAVAILVVLFAVQSRGTARIGWAFGPVMLVWFVTIAVLGLGGIMRQPGVIAALNPAQAVAFLLDNPRTGFVVLGAVFLAVTGGEALYADMGTIGRKPIRTMWYCLVLPALLLNYAGQTAHYLGDPAIAGNLFFRLVPTWAIYPMVLLATLATIIASQAIITGTYSMTRQAMQLGWFPGVRIRQTSDEEYGQIYVPFINWTMMVCTVALTVGFATSDRLAGAYGTAVSTTMLLTTALLYHVMRERWGWSVPAALTVSAIFIVIDFALFAANLVKIAQGGWVPLGFGLLVFSVMTIWHYGTEAVRARHATAAMPPKQFFQHMREMNIPRVPGTAIFLTRVEDTTPPLLIHHVEQFGALPRPWSHWRSNLPRCPASRAANVSRSRSSPMIFGKSPRTSDLFRCPTCMRRYVRQRGAAATLSRSRDLLRQLRLCGGGTRPEHSLARTHHAIRIHAAQLGPRRGFVPDPYGQLC
jgi:KUP system potassium uptake protein